MVDGAGFGVLPMPSLCNMEVTSDHEPSDDTEGIQSDNSGILTPREWSLPPSIVVIDPVLDDTPIDPPLL